MRFRAFACSPLVGGHSPEQLIRSAVVQVALHGGAPNKNIGDAFLLVWKFPKGCTVEDIARATAAPDTKELEASGSEAPLWLTCFVIGLQTCRVLAVGLVCACRG